MRHDTIQREDELEHLLLFFISFICSYIYFSIYAYRPMLRIDMFEIMKV